MRRLSSIGLRIVPTLLIVTMLVFMISRLLPGDVIALLWENQSYSKADIERERKRLGLDKPLPQQYLTWLGQTLQGNLGVSLWSKRPVTADIRQRYPVTLELAVLSSSVALTLGVSLGVLSAVRKGTLPDYAGRSFAILGLSVPAFVVATLTLLLLSLYAGWIPPRRYVPFTQDPLRNLSQFALPALILGVEGAAIIMRMTRTAVLDVLGEDYVRTARAKGLTRTVIMGRHVLKNAAPPILAVFGLAFAGLLGGTVIMENIFGLPGLGQYAIDAVTRRDYIAIQGITLISALGVLGVNAIVDLLIDAVTPQRG
jgi:peptide/nickel transport system permease protein